MIKSIKFILITALLGSVLFAFTTQQKLQEGVATFDITFFELSPEMKAAEAMLPKKIVVSFKNQNSRTEMQSGMGSTVTINNDKKKEFYILMDMMGQKTAIKQTESELKKQHEKSEFKDVKVTMLKETKTIAGYLCKKADITYTHEGKSEKIECYFTDQLPPTAHSSSTAPGFDLITGFMMEYSMNMGGIKAKVSATKITNQKIDDSLFEIPKDYTISTLEELEGMGQD
ncbi:MAG: DUF4412 domain-containing protein [Bacteroidia bacterium]|nr:DUF4412 domain-containing protein [Bacteroidia bacterium]